MDNTLYNFDKLKESITDFIKTNFPEYQEVSFDRGTSQDFITSISSYLTTLVSQRFEQSLSDFYLETQQTNKINLLLSQYGYVRSFGVPSQVTVNLSLDNTMMYQLNELNIPSFIIPQLCLKISDDNNNIWLNKNSIIIVKTPETFTRKVKIDGEEETKTYNKYQMVSQAGNEDIPLIQMDFSEQIISEGLNIPYRVIDFLNQSQGYPVSNYFIRDIQLLKLNILPVILTKGDYDEDKYDRLDLDIYQSKYHVEDYNRFVNNKYLVINYNEVLKKFVILNGDDKSNGHLLTSPIRLQFYKTQGERGRQDFGAVNKFQGMANKVIINNDIFVQRDDFDNNYDDDIRTVLFSEVYYLNRNLKTGELLPEQIPNQRISLYDFFDTQKQSSSMQLYGWKKANVMVKQVTPVISGRNVETITDIKNNFSRHIKQKDKIVTLTDIDQYIEMFLKGLTPSLNQSQIYKNVISESYANQINNCLFVLPQVFKDNNLRNIEFPQGSKIYSSDIPVDPVILPTFEYSSEKKNIVDEMRETIIQTMNVQFQESEILKIHTPRSISVWQNRDIPINQIIQTIKQKLDDFVNIQNDSYDPFTEINLLKLYIELSKINGVINIDMDSYKNQFNLDHIKELNSGYIIPQQKQLIEGEPEGIKTQYVIPISTQQKNEKFYLNGMSLHMFENQIGQLIYLGDESVQNNLHQTIQQLPINMKLKSDRMDQILGEEFLSLSEQFQMNYILDGINSRQNIQKTKQLGDYTNQTQLNIISVEYEPREDETYGSYRFIKETLDTKDYDIHVTSEVL